MLEETFRIEKPSVEFLIKVEKDSGDISTVHHNS